MHTKSYDGFEIQFPGPDLHQGEVYSALAFLRNEIEKIDEYPDKSLFFQNPRILEGWLVLVRALEKIETWEVADDKTRWEERTESNVSNLFVLRNYDEEYEELSQMYFEQLSKIQNCNAKWLVGGYIREEEMEALFRDRYEEGFGYDDDFINHLKGLVKRSIKASSKLHSVLADILGVYLTIMNRGESKIRELSPHDENFVEAIEDDLREWESSFREKMFREMKEDLNRHYKAHRTDHNTIELWSEMLDADEDALSLSKRQLLTECDEPKQEHWGDDMKMQMDENGRLMQQILSSCRSDELFDLRKVDSVWQIISLLTPDNLYMFYEIIVRRNIIQCEMFPELKTQHEEWLNKSEEHSESEETGLSPARQSKLDEIINIMQKGDWKHPATADNITQLLNTVFGRDVSLLEEGDKQLCEAMWAMVESGRGERVVVVAANLAGFFYEMNLLNGSPKTISDVLFGKNDNQSNNINKGNSSRSSNAFNEVIPFLTKYINKIIRQE